MTDTTLRDRLWATVQTSLLSFGDLTPTSVVAGRAPDCLHRIYPKTLGHPPRNNKQWVEFIRQLKKMLPDLHYIIQDDHEPVIDERRRAVFVYVRSAANTAAGPYANEYFMVFRLTEDGSQITEISEFLDTAVAEKLVTDPRIQETVASTPDDDPAWSGHVVS